MGVLTKETFVCFDCETTGLDPEQDRIIEIAAATFTLEEGVISSREDLIDPEREIPTESSAIHHITTEMVEGKPKIGELLPSYLSLVGSYIVVGHGILFDLAILRAEAIRAGRPHPFSNPSIDTVRLARLYGESPVNSLEMLRKHFNIQSLGAHRAMSDVMVNIAVFKQLVARFKTTKQLLKQLEEPILLKTMPLGKYKGRLFGEIPIEYLRWASHQEFDQDLLFSLRSELNKRKSGSLFSQASNPFRRL